MRRTRLSAAIATALLMTAGALAPAWASQAPHTDSEASAGAPAAAGRSGQSGQPATVRLITGDRVTVGVGPDGKRTASVDPGPGRDGVLFRTAEQDGKLTVLPSDALDLVSTGALDRQLFDVTALLAQGYDEAHSDGLPLIVSDPKAGSAAAGTARELTALNDDDAPSRRLTSIGARSVRVADSDLAAFWHELSPGDGEMTAKRLSATPKVWLDGRVGASLDRSTGQINAPAAWALGYQGKGVKVAVLDTGVDQTHPDLAGRVSLTKDFSGSGGTTDVFGHGTHVASIVGGTGAASGGSRKGVASQADLLVGKVLGDDGYGSESQVIEGMEWAAAQGAKVVNMSLGSDETTDGTDPMSAAVDEITERTGTLFVVAAGNNGEAGTETIGSPGAADEALTVGAVDRDDSLAPFSSRGPRVGDAAVKPDVTAPGVDIVAARAAGTTLGTPVDEYYVAASGTSMATPHVAGAAALLAQEHPDWGARELKDALISTAHTVSGTLPTEQGGGRIDLASATTGPVTATGTVALGPFQTGGAKQSADAANATIHYTNQSDKAVSLRLTAKLATTGGRELGSGALTFGNGAVQLAPGASADVPLGADPARAERGEYYGYVTATAADGTVVAHTTVSFVVHGPIHRLTVTSLDKDGHPDGGLPTIWGPDGFVDYISTDPAVAEVEEGTYQLSSSSVDEGTDGQELRNIVLPEVKVTKDMGVTLDARKTTQVQIRTPEPAEQRGAPSYQTYRQIDGHSLTQGVMYFDIAKRLYVSPTAKVTDGTFEFASRWQLVAPLIKADVVGADIDLNPYYTNSSPLYAEKGVRLTAVDAGTSAAPDLRPAKVRGKLAVVRDDGSDERQLADAAAKAGAKGLLLVWPTKYPWTRWRPDSDPNALPTVRVSAEGGAALLARVKRRSTTVAFSGTARSPYLYDVMQTSVGQVPQNVVYTVSDRNTAQVRTTYADNGGLPWASEQRFGWRPYQDYAWNQYSRFVPTGFRRTEYVSADDTTWQHYVSHTTAFDVDVPLNTGMRDGQQQYKAGARSDESWFGAVVRPSVPAGTATPSTRDGNVLSLRIPEFTDATAGHWSRSVVDGGIGTSGTAARDPLPAGDASSAKLFRDGVEVATADSAWADVEVAPGAAGYRLDLSTSRTSDEWTFGTRTATSWSFRSGTASAETALPLLQVDYDVPVDADNAVREGRRHDIGLTVREQPGLAAPQGVKVRVDASYDDGRTWTAATRVAGRGHNRFAATLEQPRRTADDAFVTLRVTATDKAGNSVRQTVERAYRLGG